MPLHPLNGGFSPTPGDKKPCATEPEPKEGLVTDVPPQERKSQTNSRIENKEKCNRIRRGGHRNKVINLVPKRNNTIRIFSTNGAGVKNGKVDSLNAEVNSVQANIVTIQETHCSQKGKIIMNNELVVFESIRKRKGGGTLVAIHDDFNPKLVKEYSDDFEILVVQINTEENNIRIISGCGPQENWEEARRLPFFIALETEIEKAELAGCSVIVEMDANSKLGNKYISGDPHGQTPNGCLLAGIIERHNLIVGNGTTKCKGTITRKRTTKDRIEQSVIDLLIFSFDLKEHFTSMYIDEERRHVLTRIRKTKHGIKVKESDHNVLISEFNCKVKINKAKDTIEGYNLKNKECQAAFKKYTSETKMLSSTVNEHDDVDIVVNRFMKKLEGCIAINFRKNRINLKLTEK